VLIDAFRAELSLIADRDIGSTTEAILALAPNHYLTVPSSSSGKYHPEDEIAAGGQLLHTKRVVRLARELGRKDSLAQAEMDILTAAAIVHDLAKFGWGEQPTRHSQKGHEYDLVFKTTLRLHACPHYQDIVSIAVLHSGRWGPGPLFDAKPIIALGAILHTADYIASRNYVLVDLSIGDSR
jgi:HD superfamily phosphodiesterase